MSSICQTNMLIFS